MWRRATGPRRELLHGLIQVAVGYEHLKRGNLYGARSLLRQGARRLRYQTRRPGVKELRDRALSDAARLDSDHTLDLRRIAPPKVLLVLKGFDAGGPATAVRVEIPRAPGPRSRHTGR